jgi:hypothetical protein
MSYYARNHLQDDWSTEAMADTQARVRDAEREAAWYFDRATWPQKAEFDETTHSLLGMTGPRADRARDAARTSWRQSTTAARTLLDRTVECLLETGEVSEELDALWTTLIDRATALKEAAE